MRALTFLVLAAAFTLLACDSPQAPAIENHGSEIVTRIDSIVHDSANVFYGGVTAYDTTIPYFVTDLSGFTIEFVGTPYSTTTNELGQWCVVNLPRGTYVMEISKPGFAPVRRYNVRYVGTGKYYFGLQGLTVVTNTTTALDSIVTTPSWQVIHGHYIKGPTAMSTYEVLFIGRSPIIDPTDPSTYVMYEIGWRNTLSDIIEKQVNRELLLFYGVQPGEKLFATVMGGSYAACAYFDYEDRGMHFSGFIPPNAQVASFTFQ